MGSEQIQNGKIFLSRRWLIRVIKSHLYQVVQFWYTFLFWGFKPDLRGYHNALLSFFRIDPQITVWPSRSASPWISFLWNGSFISRSRESDTKKWVVILLLLQVLQSTNISVEVSLYRRVCCQFKIISSFFSLTISILLMALALCRGFPFSCSPFRALL